MCTHCRSPVPSRYQAQSSLWEDLSVLLGHLLPRHLILSLLLLHHPPALLLCFFFLSKPPRSPPPFLPPPSKSTCVSSVSLSRCPHHSVGAHGLPPSISPSPCPPRAPGQPRGKPITATMHTIIANNRHRLCTHSHLNSARSSD